MKVIAKVLRFCQELLTAVSEPIAIVLQALQKLLRGVLNVLVGAPAEAVDSMGQRLFERAGSVDSSLDARAEAKREQVIKEKLDAALERLYYTDSFLTRRRSIRRWKNFWIVLVEMVSFTTTYRGLNQVLSALHFAVPLLLAVVIQTSLGYLAAVVSGSDSTPKQKGLLVVVLLISVAFSFVGVTETILPYSSYAQAQYSEFSRAYMTAKERGELAVATGNNPVAEINGQYAKVDQLLADAERCCSDETLEKAREELANYKSMTVYVVVDQRDPMYQDADGHWIRGNGGSHIEYVPDPDAKLLIEAAQKKIDLLEEQRGKIAEIKDLLQDKAEWTAVTAVMKKQMESCGTLLPEFTETSHAVQLLLEKCRELADEIQSPITIHLNLEEILRDYQRFDQLSEVEDIPAFQEIHNAWKETQMQPANTGMELLDATLAVITVNNPSLLKEQLDQTVENSYGALLFALDSVGAEEAAVSLTQAYQTYHMELPMLYAFNALRPDEENFGIAVLAAVVAVINDGLAVLIGLWMEQRCINWGSRQTIGINDLMPHLYPHFRAVIMPILRRRIGWNFDFEEARDGFVGILEDYLSRFELKPLLIREGFTRCGRLADSDPDFEKFCAFLLTWGLAKPIRPEDAKTLDLADVNDPNAQYILLSSRAEGWLIDLLGNAAELGYNELVYSV